jgi:DNA transformation protein
MSISNADIAFVKDLFAGVGTLTTRKIFGGLAIYADGVIFALINSTGALMRAKVALAEELAAEGSQQFIHVGKGSTRAAMPYWTLPCAAMDEPELAFDWAQRSLLQNS